jgi:hypothetical protein
MMSKPCAAAGAESLPKPPVSCLPTFTLLGPGVAENRNDWESECSPAHKEWQTQIETAVFGELTEQSTGNEERSTELEPEDAAQTP